MKKILLLILVIFVAFSANSQNITPTRVKYFSDSVYNGKVKIKQDVALKNFMETCVGLNKKNEGFPGYRVKVYAQNKQNSRSEANLIKSKFKEDDPKAYVKFVEPNFEVHVGNFVNRFEALALQHELLSAYPEAYILKTLISFPEH